MTSSSKRSFRHSSWSLFAYSLRSGPSASTSVLRVGLDGVGSDQFEEYFWERRLVYFECTYVGLPALDAQEYIRGDNILGVALAALMRVPEDRRAELKAEGLRRVKQSNEDDARRFLLTNMIQT
jgi:hypothetical protein